MMSVKLNVCSSVAITFLAVISFSNRAFVSCDKRNLSDVSIQNTSKYLVLEDGTRIRQSSLFRYLYPNVTSLNEAKRIEDVKFHWKPFKRSQFFTDEEVLIRCNEFDDGENIPKSVFGDEQLTRGAIILYFIGAIYFFTLLTVVCNDYFLPSVEVICEKLNISKDVAAATFMATATTTPEFFTNTISTFVTKSDLGVGTIIGSLAFNTLGVAALAGLVAPHHVKIDWWPLTRDCVLYAVNLSFLIAFAWDGDIHWYESVVFVALYINYFVILFNNKSIMRFVKYYIEDKWMCCQAKSTVYDINQSQTDNSHEKDSTPPAHKHSDGSIFVIERGENKSYDTNTDESKDIANGNGNETSTDDNIPAPPDNEVKPKVRKSLWKIPTANSKVNIAWWFYTWPIKFLLTITIPSPKTFPKLFPLTFIMCICWIGVNSYLVVWMIVRIGMTFGIPDSVMGLTFLAAGGCLPEAISAVLMARKGEGAMGVSNSLGANSLSIIFSLGVPWIIKSMIGANKDTIVNIHSYGIEWVILSLLVTIIILYAVISIAKFRLRKGVGAVLLVFYSIFITLAILVEMDIFFPSGNNCDV